MCTAPNRLILGYTNGIVVSREHTSNIRLSCQIDVCLQLPQLTVVSFYRIRCFWALAYTAIELPYVTNNLQQCIVFQTHNCCSLSLSFVRPSRAHISRLLFLLLLWFSPVRREPINSAIKSANYTIARGPHRKILIYWLVCACVFFFRSLTENWTIHVDR